MKFFINTDLKHNYLELESPISRMIENTLKILNVQVDSVYIYFDHHEKMLRSNIDEIEQIKCFSNLHFMYASYYNMSSKVVPSIIDEKSFNLIKKSFE